MNKENRKLKVLLTISTIITLLVTVILFILGKYHHCDGKDCFICSLISSRLTIISLLILIFTCPLIKITIVELYSRYNPKIKDLRRINNKIINNYYYINSNSVDLNKICLKLQ